MGVVFKLSSTGTRNASDRLTILGPESIIRLTYADFYDYTLSVFPDLITVLPMNPIIHETPFGAQEGFTRFASEFTPEAVPRIKATEAEAPTDALPALEAPVSLFCEEEQTNPGATLACVGMRADFEVHPQLSELTPPLPKNLRELWLEPVQATVA